MKRIILLLLFTPLYGLAQMGLPSYPAVLKEFFSHYNFTPKEAIDGLNFAKMRDGWHVQVIDRVTEKTKSDQPYWTVTGGFYLPLDGFEAAGTEAEARVKSFLSGSTLYLWYGYERCRYYGYSHWAEDMMADFGNKGIENYSDTLIEGLARAYSAYSSKFLWYQYGGQVDSTDSLKRKLGPLEMPSRQRVDTVAYYISKSIDIYRDLEKKNHNYATLLGNPAMKVFNEQMNAYMHLSMAYQDAMAKRFLLSVTPDKAISALARNYLDACAPNAVLFTFGDNDTYPLWYVQEREGYRKDVAVVHAGLLGLPAYVEMLKRKKIVSFSTTAILYGDPSFLYFTRDSKQGNTTASFGKFIDLINSRQTGVPSDVYGRILEYPYDTIELKVDLKHFQKIGNRPNLKNSVRVKLGAYVLNDQLLVLDIVNTNLYNRPVYFTDPYDLLQNNLLQWGPVYQFLPLDDRKEELSKRISVDQAKSYLARYKPPSLEASDSGVIISTKDDRAFFLYDLVAHYYIDKGMKDSAGAVLRQLIRQYDGELPAVLYEYDIPALLIATSHIDEAKTLLEKCAELHYQLYKKPSALYDYQSKENLVSFLTSAQLVLLRNNLTDKKLADVIEQFSHELEKAP